MKILGGELKGRNFFMPETIRPTQDILRSAIFDILGHDLEGIKFLDLFAGSGSFGLEAISRGAKEVVFVEKDPKNALIIQDNLQLLKIGYPHIFHKVVNADVFATIKKLAAENNQFDIVFFDPPFDQKLAKKILKHLMGYVILHPHSYIVAQYGNDDSLPDLENRYAVIKKRIYGSSQMAILQQV
jgi:16S rRNA (guanine966-N2)-methyltransferase